MKIVYTKHAEKKFEDLAGLGFKVNKQTVNSVIKEPMDLDEETDSPRKIASGEFDKEHILRVVYREEGARIVVVTFYPARKGRYF